MAKVFIEESTLTKIGNAIRNKTGKSALIDPAVMDVEIASITTGGGSGGGEGPEVEDVVLTGSCKYSCANDMATQFIKLFPNKVTTKDISDAEYMFNNSTLETIPFDLNFQSGKASLSRAFNNSSIKYIPDFDAKHTAYAPTGYMFNESSYLEAVPLITNVYPDSLSGLFYNCSSLKTIPDNYFDTWNFDRVKTYNYANATAIFKGCYSLRKLPSGLFEKLDDWLSSYSACLYYQLTHTCYSLDEVVNIPVCTATYTSNAFSGSFDSCCNLKRITFKTNDDGTPKTAKWKSQTIHIGAYDFGRWSATMFNYINGLYKLSLAAEKQIKDDTTYQAFKGDPDSWVSEISYSKYNHDSAVETINSLPDTSAYLATAGGTNTLKFKGALGSATDGGAINTLTEEEIAVATAKGWTVTFA